MVAPRYYLAPAARGLGDGSSRANAASYSHSKILGKLAEWKAAVQDPAADDPSGWGFEVLTGGTLNGQDVSSTNLPVGGRFYRGEKIMRHDTAVVSIAGRILLCSGLGEYSVTGNPAASDATHSGPGGAGTAANPIRMYVIESDDGAGNPMDDVGGPVDTITTTVAGKAGEEADWTSPANHGTSGWIGAVTDRTHSFRVHRPKTGVTFVGSRAKDPRTAAQRRTQQMIVNGSNRVMYDPEGTSSNPIYLQPDGKTPYWGDQGDIFDMPTRRFVDRGGATGFGLGNYWWEGGASYIAFRGIMWKDYKAPFTNAPSRPHRFVHFRDIKTDNTSYFNWRGSNASDYWGLRVDNVAWSQKAVVMGDKCYRWLFQDVTQDGAFVVGDLIKCGFSAVAPHDAGPLVIERLNGYCYWDAIPLSTSTSSDGTVTYNLNKYFQGEAGDYECYNLQVEDFRIDLCGDGAFDTKARTRWVGYRPVLFINGGSLRARRNFRLWYPAADMLDDAPARHNASLLLDVYVQDSRQAGVFAPTRSDHHRIVEWDNSRTGWAMFDRNRAFPSTHTWTAVRHEQDKQSEDPKGNWTILLWQPLDLRPSGSPSLRSGDNTDTIPTLQTTAPWRKRVDVRTDAKPTSPRLLTAGGAEHDPDTATTLTGTVSLTTPSAGDWVNLGRGTLAVAADKLSASLTL